MQIKYYPGRGIKPSKRMIQVARWKAVAMAEAVAIMVVLAWILFMN